MFLHYNLLLLATPPFVTSAALVSQHRRLDRRSHSPAPLQQVRSLATSQPFSQVLFHRADKTPGWVETSILGRMGREKKGRGDVGTCISPNPPNTATDRLNSALQSSGPGFILSLCPNAQYMIQAPIVFTAPNQEISTQGYPTDGSRATLVVNGPVANGRGHTTAVDGTCGNCNGVKLRNIQADIFALSIVDSLFTSSPGQWKSCRSCSNPGWSKYRDGRRKLESADRIRAFL